MSDFRVEKKINRYAGNLTRDLGVLAGDSAVQLSRFEGSLGLVTMNAKNEVVNWVDTGVTQMSEGWGKAVGEARGSMNKAAETVRKDVGLGLREYNARAQEAARKLSGEIGDQAVRYPWVAMTLALVLGIVVGRLTRTVRMPASQS